MATIAITGLTGLAGGAVGRHLASSGHSIIGISRQPIARFDGLHVRSVANLADDRAMTDALSGCDAVLHFADRADRRTYTEEDVSTAAHVMATIRSAAAHLRIRRIVAASSVHAECEGADRYASSKRAMEEIALCPSPGAAAIVLRLPPLHGTGAKGAVRYIARAVATGWPLPFGMATAPRRFLSLVALANLCGRLINLDDQRFEAMTGHLWHPADSDQASLAGLARSFGGGRAWLIPIPGIDRLIPGTLPPEQLERERVALFNASGWQPGL